MKVDEVVKTHVELVTQAEATLQLPPGFLRRLRDESDWSFVIKAHAVVEAAITQLLVAATRDVRLTAVFQRLPMGGRTGKLAFVKAMGLIDETAMRFVNRFSEVRNDAVHDVGSLDFTFASYMEGLKPNELRSFAIAMYPVREPPKDISRLKLFLERDAKFVTFLGLSHVLIQSHIAMSQIKLDDRLIEMDRQYAQEMRELHERWEKQDAEDDSTAEP